MSITIRLAKVGKKNAPAYKVVVSNTRDKRNGKFLDVLGFFNPLQTKNQLEIDKKSMEQWKSKGALISDAVLQLLDGKYNFVKYSPKKKAAEKEEA